MTHYCISNHIITLQADLMTETWSMESDMIFECVDLLISSDKFEVPFNTIEYTRQENEAASQK